MASAKKCDRCGVFYETNTRFKETVGLFRTHLSGMCFMSAAAGSTGAKDLCDDCISKLKMFLDGKELKED